MKILTVGASDTTTTGLGDLLARSRIGPCSLAALEASEGRYQPEAGSCDLLVMTLAGHDADILAVAETAAIPVIVLLEDAADLEKLAAWEGSPTEPVAERLPDVHLLADLTPVSLGLAIRAATAHAGTRHRVRETEMLFRITQEAAGIGTWDWNPATGRVIWSDTLCRLFGLDPGTAADDPFRVWRDAIHPDDMDATMSAAKAAMAGLVPLTVEFRIRTAPASQMPETWRWISCKGVVLRDASGQVTRLIGINIDVTDHHLINQTARDQIDTATLTQHESETRFRAYFDGSRECMFRMRVGPDGRFIYADANATGLAATGLALDQILGREPAEVLGATKGAEMTEALRAVVRTGEPVRYVPSWDMDGGRVVYDAVYMPLRDRTGTITGILGAARDITEHRRVEEALHQAQKVEAVGQLASGVVHDFNNVLSIFQTCFRLLDREPASDRARMVVTEGRAAVARGKALTDWLTGFMRQKPVVRQSIDVNAALEQTGVMLKQTLALGARLTTHLAPDLALARADPNEVALAILNLALNARDAMPDGGTLRLSTRNETVTQPQPDGIEPGRYVVVEMADTGTGMAPEVLAHVQEPFFTTKPAGRGTGLGLPMVRGIVRRAGGGLRIASVEGQGTQVSLYFPAADPTTQALTANADFDRQASERV